MTRKKNKLKEYIRLLYAKDDEIEALETKCQVQSDEISILVDKCLTALEDEVDRDRIVSEGSDLPVAELPNGDQPDQFDDEESLNSIEHQLNQLIARIGMETAGSDTSETGMGLDKVPDSESASAGY